MNRTKLKILTKNILKKITPPFFFSLVKRKAQLNHDRAFFNTYEEALERCSQNAYEHLELVEVISKKTLSLVQELKSKEYLSISSIESYSLISIFLSLQNLSDEKSALCILDFGGACGAHYFILRKILPQKIKLKWAVVETTQMVKNAKQFENEELYFFSEIVDAKNFLGEVNILHTSGALQCVDNPVKYLRNLLALNAQWIYFGRVGLNQNTNTTITIHKSKLSWNGVGPLPKGYQDKWVTYPFTFIPEQVFLSEIQKKYNISFKCEDGTGMFPIEGESIIGYGILCKHRKI